MLLEFNLLSNSKSFLAWNTIPIFSANRILIKSFSSNVDKSIEAPKLLLAKHISNKVVISPPLPISCPAIIWSFTIASWITLNALLKKSESLIVGTSVPTVFNTWAKEVPPNLKSSCDKLI